MAQVIKR